MADVVSFGLREIDTLMGGGLPRGSSYLLEVEPGTEELAFIASFLEEGLRHGEVCSLVTSDMPYELMIQKLSNLGVNVKGAMDSGSMVLVDLWDEGKYDPEHKGPVLMTENLGDPNSVVRVYYDLSKMREERLRSGKYDGSRTATCSLSSEIMRYKFEPTYKLAKLRLNAVRRAKAVSLQVTTPRMFDETVVAAFEHISDGILVLSMKEVKGRFQRFVRVKQSPFSGFYTDEVPYDVVRNRPYLLVSSSEKFRSQERPEL
jgi:KaiC/GvpD/RAD55 family RecA-like ATPase